MGRTDRCRPADRGEPGTDDGRVAERAVPDRHSACIDPVWLQRRQHSIITRDLYHRFFENIMQIDGGKSDQYVAWADSGGLVMGYFDGSRTGLWDLAQRYTLADNFFQAAYGGSFLNHQYLICACAPTASAAFVANNKPSLNILGRR
ncbi:MAG: alkaline phosphatase family protein [Gammaproteobacteria bacterium]